MNLLLVRNGRPDEDDASRPHDPRLRLRDADRIAILSVNESGHHAPAAATGPASP